MENGFVVDWMKEMEFFSEASSREGMSGWELPE